MWGALDCCAIPGGIVVVDEFIHLSISFIDGCKEVFSQELYLHCLEEWFYVTVLPWRFIPDISMVYAISLQLGIELPAPKAAMVIRLYCSGLAISSLGITFSWSCLFSLEYISVWFFQRFLSLVWAILLICEKPSIHEPYVSLVPVQHVSSETNMLI